MNVAFGTVATAGLLILGLLPLEVLGHTVVDDSGCVDIVDPEDDTVWHLVNTCSYDVEVIWCSVDDRTDERECGGSEYYQHLRTLGANARVALDTLARQDIGLAYAACRTDDDRDGFDGIDTDSLTSDGSFTCLVGQRVNSPASLVTYRGEQDLGLDASDCIALSMYTDELGRHWHTVAVHNRCSYSVEFFWSHRLRGENFDFHFDSYCGDDAGLNPGLTYYKGRQALGPGETHPSFLFVDVQWRRGGSPMSADQLSELFLTGAHFEYGACQTGGDSGLGDVATDGSYVCVRQ